MLRLHTTFYEKFVKMLIFLDWFSNTAVYRSSPKPPSIQTIPSFIPIVVYTIPKTHLGTQTFVMLEIRLKHIEQMERLSARVSMSTMHMFRTHRSGPESRQRNLNILHYKTGYITRHGYKRRRICLPIYAWSLLH